MAASTSKTNTVTALGRVTPLYGALLLGRRAGTYCYVSSIVAGFPSAGDYAARKRACELQVLRLGGTALIVRLGLVLGPHEYPGRLPYWLDRLATQEDVLVPGRPGRPIRYVDVRDVAESILNVVVERRSGTYSLTSLAEKVVTMGDLISAASATVGRHLPVTWIPDPLALRCGIRPWTQVPLWIPEGKSPFDAYAVPTDRVFASAAVGNYETAKATWAWMQSSGAVGELDERGWLSKSYEVDVLRRCAGSGAGWSE